MIQFLSLSTCIIYILDVQNLSPPRIRVRYKPLHFISSGFALLKIYRKNRNRNTNPDDGRDRHPVNQFRRRDVPDRVHFFRVDVFCFFFRERAQQQQTKEERESVKREREIANTHTRPGVKNEKFETREMLLQKTRTYLDHPGYLSPARTFVTLSSRSMPRSSSFVPPSGARLRLQTFYYE